MTIPALANKDQVKAADDLIAELRCISCGGQPLSESNAPLAKDIKTYIRREIAAGASASDIKYQLQQSYGEAILQIPQQAQTRYLLWLFPIFVISGVAGITVYRFRQS